MKIDPSQHGWMTAPETLAVMAALGEARFVGGAVRNALLGAGGGHRHRRAHAAARGAGAADAPRLSRWWRRAWTMAPSPPSPAPMPSRSPRCAGTWKPMAATPRWPSPTTGPRTRRGATSPSMRFTPRPMARSSIMPRGVEDLIAGKVRFMGDAAHAHRRRLSAGAAPVSLPCLVWQGRYGCRRPARRGPSEGQAQSLSGERVAKEIAAAVGGGQSRAGAAGDGGNRHPVRASARARCNCRGWSGWRRSMPTIFFRRDAMLRLAALLPDDEEAAHAGRPAEAFQRRSHAVGTGAERRTHRRATVGEEARRLLYRIGAARFRDKVCCNGPARPRRRAAWRMLLEMAENWQRPRFPLTGRDVMQAGVPEGPRCGRILAQVEDWWVGGDFAADEGGCATGYGGDRAGRHDI